MTHHVLDCTDCRTVLKIRDLTNPIPLHCPRCGEGLDVRKATPAAPNPRESGKKAGTGAAPTEPASEAGRSTRYSGRGPRQSNIGVMASLVIVVGVLACVGIGLYASIRYFRSGKGDVVPQWSQSNVGQPPFSNPMSVATSSGPARGIPQVPSSVMNPVNARTTAPSAAPPRNALAESDTNGQPPAAGIQSSAGIQSPGGRPSPGGPPEMPSFPRPPGFPSGPRFPVPGGPGFGRPNFPNPAGPPSGIPRGFGQIPGSTGLPNDMPGGPPQADNRPGEPANNAQRDLSVRLGMNEAGPQSTVEELLELIRSGDGGPGISRSLDLLAAHQIEPERQAEVRELLKSLMASPHVFVRKSATEAFCQWASAEDIDELRKILANTDSLYLFAKKKAIATISRLNDATLYPDLIRAISDPPLMMDATTALSEQGAGVEQAILDAFPMVEGPLPKNMLLKILQETGTATSLPFLQKLATSPDFTVRGSAEQAMQAIRARQ
jgi:hypothetical protein